MATDIDWDSVRDEMESCDWEPAEGGGESRSAFLGTVFGLAPSGKYYTPWAAGNLEACDGCGGSGRVGPRAKRRVLKKWSNAVARLHDFAARHHLVGDVAALRCRSLYRYYRGVLRRFAGGDCRRCGGMGSREAYLDSIFWEELDEEADAHGYSIENGEGDPCDVFAVEYRDANEDDAEDGEDGEDG